MSYAAVAAHNAPPVDEQPVPDAGLLEGHFDGETPVTIPDVGSGVTVVKSDFLEHPETQTTVEQEAKAEAEKVKKEAAHLAHEAEVEAKKVAKEAKAEAKKAKKYLAKKEGEVEVAVVKAYKLVVAHLKKPKIFVPLFAAFDLAILSAVGYKGYKDHTSGKRIDRKVIGGVTASLVGLFSLQSYGASVYFSKKNFDGNDK